MSKSHVRTAATLPPTVNLHVVPFCNMECAYCYAPFVEERASGVLPLDEAEAILRQLAAHGVRRATFVGGEPTLHPQLARMLQCASELGLVTAIVTNATLITRAWLDRHGPHLRWLTLSIDSVQSSTVRELGRHPKGAGSPHLEQVVEAATLVHEYNRVRPDASRIRLKINITVTSANAAEDPRLFIRACAPERVKVLQMLLVEGENDCAKHLVCETEVFEAYAARVRELTRVGIDVVVEDTDDMDGSYAMIDPRGRFFQRVDGRYVRSAPIPEVGALAAWQDVGGFDAVSFEERGGVYDSGNVPDGNRPYWIAIEGLDGSGKSTLAAMLAARLGAVLVTNPPADLAADRAAADDSTPDQRRAWYRAANDEAARRAIAALDQGRAVVMDRSVASTLAFAAAETGRVATAREWPDDVPHPDLLVLLDVDEQERVRRISARAGALTSEEQRLVADEGFRNAVLDGYIALGALRVDASVALDGVLRAVLAHVRAGTVIVTGRA